MKITVALVVALVFGLVAGAAGGYAARALTVPVASATQQAAAACPSGTHAVVWYTAKSWSCVSN